MVVFVERFSFAYFFLFIYCRVCGGGKVCLVYMATGDWKRELGRAGICVNIILLQP